VKKLTLILILLPTLAFAQAKEQLPTGEQYLASQLVAAELKVAQMLGRIAELEKQVATMREMMTKKEKPAP